MKHGLSFSKWPLTYLSSFQYQTYLSFFPSIHQMEGMFQSLNQEEAIRRFCPARLDHGRDDDDACDEFEDEGALSLLYHPLPLGYHHHASSEEDHHLVNSFFNMDDQNQHQPCHLFGQQWAPMAMMPTDDVYGNIPMMTQGDNDDDDAEISHGEEEQGLHLVNLLLACAETIGCRDTQLAHSILTQIWSSSNPWGHPMQRLSYCFAMGFTSRLSLLLNNNNLKLNATLSNGASDHVSWITRKDKNEAFHLLHQTTPYIGFGFMAANEAICQAAQGKDYLHIVDLGMEHSFQWPSLITSLASRTEGPPKLVRITGIVEGNQDMMLELQSSMKGIVSQGGSFGILMEFQMIASPASTTLLTRQHLDLREKEALFINSIVHLHTYVKESRGSLKSILQAIKKLGPTLLTVVAQDANHNGPFFLGRFLESLHYYSAIFDSLEASLARNSWERMKIEKVHFAEEIRNIVGYEGRDRIQRHERADQWRKQLGRAGFQIKDSTTSTSQAKARAMVANYGCDGYTVTSDKGCLLLGWKGRPLMFASSWQLPNNNA